ncbi:RNA polymerase sigma factor SigJ [Actinomycetes bacterium KLBMP 9797]
MNDTEFLAAQLEEHRGHLRAVAYRLLGSLSEADDAIQEAWLRASRADTAEVENLRAWLTTITARVCLNMLRSRNQRREEPLDVHVPDPIIDSLDGGDPEHEAVLADSVGLALLVVLETLTPAERLAFVLHDLFALPFDDIAPLLGRNPAAARQLASRARRRVQGAAPAPDPDLGRQRAVVEAFLAASRGGDLQTLVALLDPDIVLRADNGARWPATVLRGADAVANGAFAFARITELTSLVMVNGAIGAIGVVDGQPISVAAFTVVDGRIVAMDVIADPERVAHLNLDRYLP